MSLLISKEERLSRSSLEKEVKEHYSNKPPTASFLEYIGPWVKPTKESLHILGGGG